LSYLAWLAEAAQEHRAGIARSIAVAILFAQALLNIGASPAMAFSLTSPAFNSGAKIPSRFTCEGDDVSPPLMIAGVPEGAKSLALIIDDPDAPDPKAPKRVWAHWLLFNLPADVKALPEDAARNGLPEGTVTGVSDRKQTSYHGPCPPIGRHRYFHKLYALDTMLPAKPLTKAELEAAIQGHVLAESSLMATYQKGDP
jgi:Raf kinase inhibitor-like YbhB/YbcL family protein